LTRQVRSYHIDSQGVALAADREVQNFQTGNPFIQIKSTEQPVYLRELSDYQPVRTLRSSSKHLLTVNVAETVLATRDFRHDAVGV